LGRNKQIKLIIIMAQGTTKGVPIDTDNTLAANSDILVPSQKAIKAYITNLTYDATKIANGSVSNTEFQYLDGVTSAIQTQIDSKAPINSPTFTGTVGGITKSMVGLGNVDNTSDANKPVSTATQTALDAKQATLTNPVTGTGTNNEIAAFNSTGSTITSLSTTTYPSLTEFSYGKGVTSAIQTQLDNRSVGIATSGSVSITIGSTGTANLQSLTGHTFTIVESLMPIGATIQINGLSERLSGTGTGGISYDINGTKRYISTPSGHQFQYQITLYRESSTTIRMMGGGAGAPFTGAFGSANQATTTGAVTSGGNIVFQLFGYGTVTSDVVAYRFFKAILTR
jgi:hypothetical protein